MYTTDKAEHELAVENGLSDSRGRPAAIPSEPRWPAATWHRTELRQEHAVFANNRRAKARSDLPPSEERAALWDSRPRSGLGFPALPWAAQQPPGESGGRPLADRGSQGRSTSRGRAGAASIGMAGWPEPEGTHPRWESWKAEPGLPKPRVPCLRDECAHARSNKSVRLGGDCRIFTLHANYIPQQPHCKYFLVSHTLPWAEAGCFPRRSPGFLCNFGFGLLWFYRSERSLWVAGIKTKPKPKPAERGARQAKLFCGMPRAPTSPIAPSSGTRKPTPRAGCDTHLPLRLLPALPACQRQRGTGEGASSLTGRACLGARLCLLPWLLFLPPKGN